MSTPPVSPSPAPMTPPVEKHGAGGIVALVVIGLALLAGGYFLIERMGAETRPMDTTMPVPGQETMADPGTENDVATANAPADIDPNTVQGTSIDLTEIERDLDATDLDTITADLNAI